MAQGYEPITRSIGGAAVQGILSLMEAARGDAVIVQDKIAIFEVSHSILKDQGVLFTDGNASNQRLSKTGGERVGIIPETVLREECQRKYHPYGPYGTSASRSDFYGDITFLDRLDWDSINNRPAC